MTTPSDTRPVLFLDIDNTLYSKSHKVHDMMGTLIDKYFTSHLTLSQADATHLHTHYYTQYGLAIEGLVRHHSIDPLEYNAQVDDALPLETVLGPDAKLKALLSDIDRTKVKVWLFTNAYVNHARRVVRLLGLGELDERGRGELFEGLTFCDYSAATEVVEDAGKGKGEIRGFVCKPHRRMFEKAMEEAGVGREQAERCFFVDDSALNCRAAAALKWTAVHLVESDEPAPSQKASQFQISSLYELPDCLPQFFKSKLGQHASSGMNGTNGTNRTNGTT